jgi:DNA adenine methylase
MSNNSSIKMIKPILKWVGGKTQILDEIIPNFPSKIKNYHEIFLGGGSVLFALLSNNKIKISGNIYAYDFNEPLIYVYKNIQSNHIELFNQLEILINEFNSCSGDEINRNPLTLDDAKKSQENYYYWIRDKYKKLNDEEKKSIIGSSMFIFLNKTCFRGIFRVGPHGFNVPYGHYKNPEIINKEHLEEVHNLIKNVIFEHSDFEMSIKKVKKGDFTYLDPPYVPENVTSFVKYTKEGFTLEKHKKLFEMCQQLKSKFMMSNSNTDLVKEYFINGKFNIKTITAKRSINSKNPGSQTKEIIIQNY